MTSPAVPFAVVLHANQLIIGDGYEDRDGISATASGYDAVLTLHQEIGVPAALHLSGSLVESLAWHRPDVLARIRAALGTGLVSLVGGVYGENIVPLSTPAHNRRQLAAMDAVMQDLLGVDPRDVTTAWLPERVWRTEEVVSALTDPELPGGGYSRVLLDDRQLLPRELDGSAVRDVYDRAGPYCWPQLGWPATGSGLAQASALQCRRVAGTTLTVVPMSAHLRYLVPPVDCHHLRLLDEMAVDLMPFVDREVPPVLVLGDDLERLAGVAGWEPALDRYEQFLQHLARSPFVEPVALDTWCDRHPAADEVSPEATTYYELARLHGAGEDYRQWAEDERWLPYARRVDDVERSVEEAMSARPNSSLVRVADRLCLLARHETAWQDADPDGLGRAPAPWVRATAAHVADALPLLEADRWLADPRREVRASVEDVDGDGEDELVVAGRRLFVVVRPAWGARATVVARLDDDGQPHLIVGNPADHWNFQEELGRAMKQPEGHPGACGLVGHSDCRFTVSSLELRNRVVVATLDELDCPDGVRLTLGLGVEDDFLCARWSRRGLPGDLTVRSALCPDYWEALRRGRTDVQITTWARLTAASLAGRTAWLAAPAWSDSAVAPPAFGEAGHAVVLTVNSAGRHLDLAIGGGDTDLTRVNIAMARLGELAGHASVGGPRELVLGATGGVR